MKGSICVFPGRWFCIQLLAAAMVLAGVQARADITLTDGNSVAKIDPTSAAGMYYWAVQNSPATFQNQLNKQWFWYRVGTTDPEAAISSISAPVISGLTSTTATLTYTDLANRFNVRVTYSLAGGAAGSGTSDIGEQITINNTSGGILNFHFFQYSDFNMGGDGANDTLVLSKNAFTLRFNQADQLDGANLVEVVNTPNANHGEADLVPNTLNKLTDGLATILDDSKTNAGPGDVAWALQWDVNIADGGSFQISKDKQLVITYVPEPSSVALLALGLGVGAVYYLRRNRV